MGSDLVKTKDNFIKKSNFLISAKYKATIMENKIIAIAMGKLIVRDNVPFASLTVSELKNYLSVNSIDRNIYRDVKRAVKSLVSHPIILEDQLFDVQNDESVTGRIHALSFITNAVYENGRIDIWFNKEFKGYMFNLKNNFTLFELQIMMKFTKDYTFRLYELLRKEVYKIKDGNCIMVSYSLSELKCLIGIVDINKADVRIAIERGKSWDYIVEDMKTERTFVKWGELERKVVKVAQKEIKELSDISFEYKPIKRGRGGKVVGIDFYVYKNANKDSMSMMTNNDYLQLSFDDYSVQIDELYDEFNQVFTKEQLYDLLRLSEYNCQIIREAYNCSLKQKYIDNLMGWIKAYIKNGGYNEKSITVSNGSVEQGEKIQEVLDDYNKNKEKYSLLAWKKIKGNNDFTYFLQHYDLDLELLELTKSSQECIKLYVDWKLTSK